MFMCLRSGSFDIKYYHGDILRWKRVERNRPSVPRFYELSHVWESVGDSYLTVQAILTCKIQFFEQRERNLLIPHFKNWFEFIYCLRKDCFRRFSFLKFIKPL